MTRRRSQLLSFGFLVLLAVLVGAGYVVAQMAQSAVLASQSGSISEYSLDPDEPGLSPVPFHAPSGSFCDRRLKYIGP